MKLEGAMLVDNGVAGVITALITNYHAGVMSQVIHDPSLALIAPLGSHYRGKSHIASSSHSGFSKTGGSVYPSII
jgi:hypothetical protein